MGQGDLHYLSISELAPLLRRRDVSPVELTEAFLDRIERYGEDTRAYITVTAERALSDARSAEAALMAGNDLGPLHGIPLALKDLCDTPGIRTTSGSRIRSDHVPERPSTVAARLAQAGTVLLGKTNMVEFAFGAYGLNPHYGTPPNPWDAERVPGGSSSGSGVAVASGLATAAIGTDTGGSVRIPASYCGIVGLKPTLARVSRAGVAPLSWTLDSVGPMTRSVEDASLMLSAIGGPDPRDPVTLGRPAEDLAKGLKRNVKGMRVGVVRNPLFQGADTEVIRAVEQAVDVLTDAGVRADDMAFPEMQSEFEEEEAGRGSLIIMRVEGYTELREELKESGSALDPRIRKRLEAGAEVSAADYLHVLKERERAMGAAQERLRTVDAVVGPTMLTPAPRIVDVGDKPPGRLTTRLVNYLGLCAISLPCGHTSEGLPVGLQLIGKPFDESSILQLAYAYEQATSWHRRRPPGLS